MSTSTVNLATSTAEVAECGRAAAGKDGKPIILVPVDFSAHSEAALLRAAEFAERMSAALIVLHVVHDPGEMPGYYSKLIKKKRATRMQDVAGEALAEFMDRTQEENPGSAALADAQLLMIKGLPVTRILEVVKQVEPIMVIMGSQGRTGLKNLVIGSKANQVVQLCPVPVTIVKKSKDVAAS